MSDERVVIYEKEYYTIPAVASYVDHLAALLRKAQKYARMAWARDGNEEARALSVEIGATLQPYENGRLEK
jgi:hypothetical protein